MKQEKLGRQCKERMAKELENHLHDHPDFVITGYMGTDVSRLEQLRKNLKSSSSQYIVVKNSILSAVFDKLKLLELSKAVEGGTGVSFLGQDLISACKTLASFAKENANFKIKGGILEGRLVSSESVGVLAAIPSKNYMLARVVAGVKSPITGFVNTLGGILRKFVYCIEAIKAVKKT